jgi:TonB-linked SusC/RagA family outer membrane protein
MKKSILRTIVNMSKYSVFGMLLQLVFFNLLMAKDLNTQQVKSVKEVYVEVGFDNAPMHEVFSTLENLTNYRFFMHRNDIEKSLRFSLSWQSITVADVLLKISKDANLSFKQLNENISVKKVKPNEKNTQQLEIVIQTRNVSGKVTSQEDPEGLPGVNVIEKGTSNGTITNADGVYSLQVAEGATLVFSSVGYVLEEVNIGNRSVVDLKMAQDIKQLDELVVVGYGVQKRSDITGTVASIGQERLDMIPNLNIAQTIQGAIPGVMIQTTSAGAASNEVIMVRGRNSIRASNDPLIVVDGVQYNGEMRDINPKDVESIEVLKDASAAAIYGSRGANGVILITTKGGRKGELVVSYNGSYSLQNYANVPDIMNGEEFYTWKMAVRHHTMTNVERDVYESGAWVNWFDEIVRTGQAHQHNLSLSGGTEKTNYYVSGGLLDVKGLTINDNYLRITNRINVDTDVKSWLTFGTRSQFSYDDRSGVSPSWGTARGMNPLLVAYEEDGSIKMYPWEGNTFYKNPLSVTLYDDLNESYQIITNNYAILDVPFIEGLSYRLNTGFRFRFADRATYRGRNTGVGLEAGGEANTSRTRHNNTVIENIVSYNRSFGRHSVFATAVYGFENDKRSSHAMYANRFPHDFLNYYSIPQAGFTDPSYSWVETSLISQMLRFNYAYDSRYLLTLTGRRDGFSGFGTDSKYGIFPSIALAWNLHNESFFPYSELLSEIKFRTSYGLNGNQAVGAYEAITRLGEYNMVDAKVTAAGYRPSILGDTDLGWESSQTFNVGLDFGILNDRFSGDINIYRTNTKNLLLDRTISSIHGITSIVSNIGETKNTGFEFSINSRNISSPRFRWITSANMAHVKNEIVSLYGILDEDGVEVDDVANRWFIGKPIRVNYDFRHIGTWQINEAEEAEKWGSKPGFVKIQDVNGDYKLDVNDLQIIGQQDPNFLWGMNNTFSFDNFRLDVFIHGVHGVTMRNTLMTHFGTAELRGNELNKNWWTPDNPTNDWYMMADDAYRQGGVTMTYYENKSFVRLKDVSLSYNLSNNIIDRIGLKNLRVFLTGRNLYTITKWTATDPELSSQNTPLQREYMLGIDFGF